MQFNAFLEYRLLEKVCNSKQGYLYSENINYPNTSQKFKIWKCNLEQVGSEVLTAVIMKTIVFWAVTSCSYMLPLKHRYTCHMVLYPRRQTNNCIWCTVVVFYHWLNRKINHTHILQLHVINTFWEITIMSALFSPSSTCIFKYHYSRFWGTTGPHTVVQFFPS